MPTVATVREEVEKHWKELRPLLLRIATRAARQPQDAEEILSHTLLRISEMGDLVLEKSVKSFCILMLHREIPTYYRQQDYRKAQQTDSLDSPDYEALEVQGMNPEQ